MAPNDSPAPTGPNPPSASAAWSRPTSAVARATRSKRRGWLTGDEPLSVLELGSGTGKLTRELVALGHDVHATDPDAAMLDVLARNYVVTRISQTTAEEIPVPDSTFDIVIAAQGYHWFDHDRALPEIARVLKRGGSLSLVWNTRDERIPWVKRLGRVIGSQEQGAGPGDELETSPYFGPVEHETFKHWQGIDRSIGPGPGAVALQRRHPVGGGPRAKLREVLAFYDEFGRGMDGMQLPYVTQCYRAVVGIKPQTAPRTAAATRARAAKRTMSASDTDVPARSPSAVDPPTDDDSGMLLIDFR